MKRSTKVKIAAGVILLLVVSGAIYYSLYLTGRSSSRALGKSFRQVLEVENMNEEISASFDKRGNSTVKDVTFLANDGYHYTIEFKDLSPFGGVIRWVPYNESDSMIQSRAISRWTGGVVNLRLPEDFAIMKNVDIGYTSSNERVKNLSYISTDNKWLVREYREGFIDRHFEGWIEIKSVQE